MTEAPFTKGEEESPHIVIVVSTSSACTSTASAQPLRTELLRTPPAAVVFCRLAAQHLWRQVMGWQVISWPLDTALAENYRHALKHFPGTGEYTRLTGENT